MLEQRLFKVTERESALAWLCEQIAPFLGPRTLIDCGHFLLEVDAHGHITNGPDAITAFGFELGIRLYRSACDVPAAAEGHALSFLVGDFAYPPALRTQAKQLFRLPRVYQLLLKDAGIHEEELLLFYESQLRNRAIRRSKTFHKQKMFLQVQDVFRLRPETTGLADVVGKVQGNVCLPFCRFILAQKLADEEAMRYRRVVNIYDERMYMCRGNFVPMYYAMYQGKLEITINVYLLPAGNDRCYLEIRRFTPRTYADVL